MTIALTILAADCALSLIVGAVAGFQSKDDPAWGEPDSDFYHLLDKEGLQR